MSSVGEQPGVSGADNTLRLGRVPRAGTAGHAPVESSWENTRVGDQRTIGSLRFPTRLSRRVFMNHQADIVFSP